MNTRIKSDYVYVLLIFILLSVLLMTYSKNRTLLKAIELQENSRLLSASRNDNNSSMSLKVLDSNRKYGLENNGIKLLNTELRNQKGEKTGLNAIVWKGNDNKLIVRISDMFCNTCNEYLLLKLQHKKDSIGIDNIIVIGSFQNTNSLKILSDNLKIPFQIYNTTDNDAFNYLPIESESFPYCFIIDKTKTIQNVYLPNKSVPEISEKYFEAIAKRYFNN